MRPRRHFPLFFFLVGLLSIKGCYLFQPLPPFDTIKITTRTEGVYQLSARDLGWSEFPTEINLTFRGSAHPYWIEITKNEPHLVFYAPSSTSDYSTENVFFLHPVQKGRRMEEQRFSSPDVEPVEEIFSELELEENQTYEPLAVESPWLGVRLVAPQSVEVPFVLSELAPGKGSLEVSLWGKTSSSFEPDHQIRLVLNGEDLGVHSWDGQGFTTVTLSLPDGLLQPEENLLEIKALGPEEDLIDIVFLDKIRIVYPRNAEVSGLPFWFTAPDDAVSLSGFSPTSLILDITDPTSPVRLIPTDPGTKPVLPTERAHRYLLIEPEGYQTPRAVSRAVLTPDLRSSEPGADYLIIGPSPLLAEAEPLLQHREQQGLTGLSVPAQAVYDQFGYGFKTPEAIREFLTYASSHWTLTPRYVLLLGDATYDPKGYQTSSEGNLLPTFLIETYHGGQTGSDIPMAELDSSGSDPWPDLAIGRFPARTPKQVRTMVDKTIQFESRSPQSDGQKVVLAIADGQEAYFREDAGTFLNQFESPYQTELIAPEAGQQDVAREIQTRLERGVYLTAYFGHGSLRMWGKDALFTTENTAALQNDQTLPVILNFTCLTGLFTHPQEISLAESYLWNPDGGAAAVLAPSSLTLPDNQQFLSNAIAQAHRDPPGDRLGDMVLEAWRSVPLDSQDARDVMRTFMIFGDPALVIFSHPE